MEEKKQKGNNKKQKGNNKKQKLILLVIILLLGLSGVGVFLLLNGKKPEINIVMHTGEWDVSWYDENEKEFVITTKEQLFGLSELAQDNNFAGKTIKLGADIVVNEGNAKDWVEESPTLEWTPIGRDKMPFNGTFDGQGYTITGLYCNNSDELTGLFAATDDKSQIMNFKIVNSYFKMRGDQGTGAVAGRGAGLYSQIYSDAIIDCEGWYAGGIMGYKKNKGSCTISECWYDGSITVSGRMAGGIVGKVFRGGCTIQHCHNTGNIYSTFPGPQAATIGGIAGNVSQLLTITDCLNTGLLANEVGRPEVASIIGSVSAAGDITAGLNWSTREGAASSVGSINADASVTGTFSQLPEKALTGFGAYQRTDLNFDKYWAVVEDGTPMLQIFADTVPSVAGYERCMEADTSWYSVTRVENVITTPEQLKGFAVLSANGETFRGKIIKLGANITYNIGKAANYAKDIPLNMWNPINKFMGIFDGQGYTISGLYVGGATDHVGMFALTDKQAVVKNFKLVNSYFESTTTNNNYGTGSVVGAGGGTIERVYSNTIVVSSARYGGGIIGLFNRDGSVSECWFDGEVAIAGRRSGGIAGACHNHYISNNPVTTETKISHCLNTGYIHRTDKSAKDSATSGGIVGVINNKAIIEDCFSAGKVTSPKYEGGKSDELGAIVSAIADGANGTIKDCWGTIESYKKAVTTVKEGSVSNITLSQVLEANLLTGYRAAQFTTLNFSKYWAVDLDGTPVLKYFAKSSPSLAGVSIPNTSWYSEKKTEYVINTVEELYGLSVVANSGVKFEGKTVKLGSDIAVNTGDADSWKTSAPTNQWFPIKDFAGTFDGQGHTLSGLFGTDDETSIIGRGLFAKTVETAVIQNFRLTNSYFETKTVYALSAISSRGCGTFKNIYTDAILNNIGGGHTGGILGMQLWNDTTIENCWFDGEITDTGRRIGGILGYPSKNKATISHCLYTGSISRVGDKINEVWGFEGGIVGTARGTMTITDCLSVGTFMSERENDKIGSLIGETVSGSDITLKNLYASKDSWSKIIGYNGNSTDDSTCVMLAGKYLTGENASLLTLLDFANYWAVIQGETPQLKTFASGNVISNPKVADIEWYKNGIYQISDMEELYGLRVLSMTNTFAGKTITMTRDIEVNAKKDGTEAEGWNTNAPAYIWLPIQDFAGEFNGQGFTISGLYGNCESGNLLGMSLFSQTDSKALIQNVSIANTYFENHSGRGLGAIASRGAGTFKNLSSNAILNNVYGSKTAGVLGRVTGVTTVENCWFSGSITDSGQRSGGIVGDTNGNKVTIEHCMFSGSISRVVAADEKTASLMGGILGSANGTILVNDCFSDGIKFESTREPSDNLGSLVGETVKGSKVTLTNLYANEDALDKEVRGNSAGADLTTVKGIAYSNLLGLKACYNTTLDFDNYWAAREKNTPILKIFVDDAEELPLDDIIEVSTTWFNEEANKGTITTAGELYGFAELAEAGKFNARTVITLGNEIVVNTLKEGETAEDWADDEKAPVNVWKPISNFKGTFDGQDNAIRGIYVKSDAVNTGVGLFGSIEGATIQNLRIEDGYFCNTQKYEYAYVGSVAGRGYGTLRNVYSNAILDATSSIVGGLIGYVGVNGGGDTNIVSCWFDGTIENSIKEYNYSADTGGLVGYTRYGNLVIDTCLNSGSIAFEYMATKANTPGRGVNIGGFVGRDHTAVTVKIRNSLSAGNINLNWLQNESLGTSDTANKFSDYGTITGTSNKVTLSNVYSAAKVVVNIWREDAAGNGTFTDATSGKPSITGVTYIANTDIATKLYGNLAKDNTKLAFTLEERETANKTTGENETACWVTRDGALPIPGKSVSPLVSSTAWYNDPDKNGNYHIKTIEDLYGLADLVNKDGISFSGKTIYLDNTIEVNKVVKTDEEDTVANWKAGNVGSVNVWVPIGNNTHQFDGTFDGLGNTIRGVYTKTSLINDGVGLFGYIKGATIQNLRIEDGYFCNTQKYEYAYVGSVAGRGYGTLRNVYSNAILDATSSIVGGLIGYVGVNGGGDTNIVSCWFDGTIENSIKEYNYSADTGGLAGYTRYGNLVIDTCLNSGSIAFEYMAAKANTPGRGVNIGGFVGRDHTAVTVKIRNSLSAGNINLNWLQNESLGVNDTANKFSDYGTVTGTSNKVTLSNVYSVAKVVVNIWREDAAGNGTFTDATSGKPSITGVEYIANTDIATKLYGDFAKEYTDLAFSQNERQEANKTTGETETVYWTTQDMLPIPSTLVREEED